MDACRWNLEPSLLWSRDSWLMFCAPGGPPCPPQPAGAARGARQGRCPGVLGLAAVLELFTAPSAPSLGAGSSSSPGRALCCRPTGLGSRWVMAELCSETREREGKGDPGQPAAESHTALPGGACRELFRRYEPERLRSADPCPLTETARAPSASPAMGSPSSSSTGLESYCSACFYTWPDATGKITLFREVVPSCCLPCWLRNRAPLHEQVRPWGEDNRALLSRICHPNCILCS